MKKLFIVTSYLPMYSLNPVDGELPVAFRINIVELECSDKMELTHKEFGDSASLVIEIPDDNLEPNELFDNLIQDALLHLSPVQLPPNHIGLFEPLENGYKLPVIPLILFANLTLSYSTTGCSPLNS